MRVAALEKMEQTPFFQTMRVKVFGLYASDLAYKYFGYEGEAFLEGRLPVPRVSTTCAGCPMCHWRTAVP